MVNDNIKFNLYRLKILIIQSKYNKKLNIEKFDDDLINLMKEYIDNLKRIDLIYTLADIESIKFGNTSYPDNLYANDVTNKLCFYSIFLGFIDGYIDYLKNIYNDNSNKLLSNYKEIRNKIFIDFKTSISNYSFKLLNNEFNYEDLINLININNLDKIKIFNSYKIGYINYFKYDFYKVYTEYLNLFDELNDFKEFNRKKFEKAKINKKVK